MMCHPTMGTRMPYDTDIRRAIEFATYADESETLARLTAAANLSEADRARICARGADLVRAIRESTQQNVDRAGRQITEKNLNIQPTIKIRPGWPVRVIVQRDLVLKPYGGEQR